MNQKEFEVIWHSNAEGVVCHTSGSTGDPKEIILTKDFMRQSARRTVNFFGINSDSRLHTCLDFDYIASKMMTVRSDVAKCLLTSETPSNRPLTEIDTDERIDLLSVVPSQMEGILNSGKKYIGIRTILIGGSPIPEGLRLRVVMSGHEVWESYGMTETASHIALRRVTDDPTLPFETLPGIQVSSDERGCLRIEMPGRETIITNDMADVISPTQFRILGRYDDCIISGGIKIMPAVLEEMLGGFIRFDYCISSVPDRKWGERLVMAVESGGAGYPDEFIKSAVEVRLNQYKKKLNLGVKAPKNVVTVDFLPRTANGKVDRKKLKMKLAGNG